MIAATHCILGTDHKFDGKWRHLKKIYEKIRFGYSLVDKYLVKITNKLERNSAMLLKIKTTGCLVEACDLGELTDPCSAETEVRRLRGYNEAEPTKLRKSELVFVSGENLPNCWLSIHPKQASQYRI